jgi:DNA-binding protein H-NS
MLNELMSLTTNTKTKKQANKKASTEHVKSADVTHNKHKNQKQTKRLQQNMLNQLMSLTPNTKTKK